MLKVNIDVDNLKGIDEQLSKVKRSLSQDKLNKYIQNKVLKTLQDVMNERLTFSGATVETYKSNNKIIELYNGFILYNDTTVDTTTDGYNGFSIALAFEYGTGIIGQNNPKEKAWKYNVNNHEKGWNYYKNDSWHYTSGYQGFEIYRYTADRVNKNLKSWLREYYSKKEV